MVSIQCMHCNKFIPVDITLTQLRAILDRGITPIHKVVPELSPEVRELFISNTCSDCWDKMFKNIEE